MLSQKASQAFFFSIELVCTVFALSMNRKTVAAWCRHDETGGSKK